MIKYRWKTLNINGCITKYLVKRSGICFDDETVNYLIFFIFIVLLSFSKENTQKWTIKAVIWLHFLASMVRVPSLFFTWTKMETTQQWRKWWGQHNYRGSRARCLQYLVLNTFLRCFCCLFLCVQCLKLIWWTQGRHRLLLHVLKSKGRWGFRLLQKDPEWVIAV